MEPFLVCLFWNFEWMLRYLHILNVTHSIFAHERTVSCNGIKIRSWTMPVSNALHTVCTQNNGIFHDDIIKWKLFPRYWPFVRESIGHRRIHFTKANDAELWCFLWSAPEKNVWLNNREAGDLRRHCAHYSVTVMYRGHRRQSTLLCSLQIWFLNHILP